MQFAAKDFALGKVNRDSVVFCILQSRHGGFDTNLSICESVGCCALHAVFLRGSYLQHLTEKAGLIARMFQKVSEVFEACGHRPVNL
jgi:hypothetical protein